MDSKTRHELERVGKLTPKGWIKKAADGDQKAIDKVEAFQAAKVKALIESGTIPPPERDAFVKKMEKKMQK
jgi:hypothetical protein